MKVLVIGFTKIAYMPYMNFYINQLQKSKSEVSLVYWKRDSNADVGIPNGIKAYCFKENLQDSEPLIKKIPYFIKYRSFVKQIIKNNEYDLIIVLHSTPGVLLSDVLMRKYRGRYILDYRDFTYENITIYKKIIHGLVKKSIVTFVSSDAFRKYLPSKHEIHTTHNLLMDSMNNRDIRTRTSRKREKIRIRYWGFIRHEDININLIKALENDKRFELHYHGREQKTAIKLKEFCNEHGINNVYFHGEYKPSDRNTFAADSDLIHNIFENDKTMKPAMSNKFYDGIVFYIPQICNLGSYMGDEITKSGLGVAIDPIEKGFADTLYNYYNSIDWTKFVVNCDRKLDAITEEYNQGINVVRDLLTRKKV